MMNETTLTILHPSARPDWLDLQHENAIEPDLEIVDAHHHIWGEPGPLYSAADLLDDIASSGHNVVATVFVQGGTMYRTGGAEEMRPLGETEQAANIGAAAQCGSFGGVRICDRIVGYIDLRHGERVNEIVEQHVALAKRRFVGVRQSSALDDDPAVRTLRVLPPRGLLADPKFREGFSVLGKLGVSFDAWLYHPQLPELTELARAIPQTRIIVDHLGGPVGVGSYAGKRDDVFVSWQRDIRTLSECENVFVKLGGLAMRVNGFAFHERPAPPSSDDLAESFRPFIETCIECFGPKRGMFESNFPVDKASCSYAVLWNAFKKIASGCSAEEKRWLFHNTAAQVYQMD